jgi:alkanesulfonate monooxygenase SsuD/methylene tetrahydromethanopterin reductase-like flavin-dependent oxidoreductase (luciferase family)
VRFSTTHCDIETARVATTVFGMAKVVSKVAVAALPPVRAGVCADPEWMVGFARHAEACGFESIVTVEHAVVISDYTSRYPYAASGRMPLPDHCAIPDPLDTLAFVAGATTTLGLATGIVVLPVHHPVVLAKRLATIDVLSKGRLRLGVGLGWMREEIEACGTDFDSRARRANESIAVMRALWAPTGPQGASFAGEFFHFSGAHSYPKPLRPSGIGLQGDELVAAIERLKSETEAAGRDPEAIEVTVTGVASTTTAETIDKVAQWGINRLVVTCMRPDLDEAKEELSAVAERVGLVAPKSPAPSP